VHNSTIDKILTSFFIRNRDGKEEDDEISCIVEQTGNKLKRSLNCRKESLRSINPQILASGYYLAFWANISNMFRYCYNHDGGRVIIF